MALVTFIGGLLGTEFGLAPAYGIVSPSVHPIITAPTLPRRCRGPLPPPQAREGYNSLPRLRGRVGVGGCGAPGACLPCAGKWESPSLTHRQPSAGAVDDEHDGDTRGDATGPKAHSAIAATGASARAGGGGAAGIGAARLAGRVVAFSRRVLHPDAVGGLLRPGGDRGGAR